MKIRNRLTYRFSLLSTLILVFFSSAIYLLSAHFLKRELHKRLKEKAHLTADILLTNEGVDSTIAFTFSKSMLNRVLDEKVFIGDTLGHALFNSFENTEYPFTAEQLKRIVISKEYFFEYESESALGILVKSDATHFIVVIVSRNIFDTELHYLRLFLIGCFIGSIIIVFSAGYYFSKEALKPVERIVVEVDKISATNLTTRIDEGNGKDELAHLAQTFNSLLQRLETAFTLQRNFVANASHELRTPLSAITAQLEVTLLNQRTVDEYQMVMQSVLEDIRELNRFSDGLLDLTLASRDVSLMKFNHVRIDDLLLVSRAELLKRNPDYNVNVHFGELPEDEKGMTIYGKEHLLKSTFVNLMDNGCKYNSEKHMDVYLEFLPGKISIRFKDKGIGMPDNYLQKIFTPLLRGDNAKRIPGHGLGLALAKKIIELHHAEILVFSEEGKGTEVSLVFYLA